MKSVIKNPDMTTSMSNGSMVVSKQVKLKSQLLRIKAVEQIKRFQIAWELNQQQLCDYFNNYECMEASKMNAKSLFGLSNTRLIRSDNKIYFGQVLGKKKHGRGIALNKDGKIYEGDFLQNDKQGNGCQIYKNGNVYLGQFGRNKKHGRGTFYWFNLGDCLCKNDNEDDNLQRYEGQWWGGLPDGQGTHLKINGDFYEGQFKNGLKHGNGKEIYHNGDSYKGQFVNGQPEGLGNYTWKNGCTYEGNFKQGFRNGYGSWQKSSNSKESYKGHLKMNEKSGYGIYTWENGYVYKGNFLKNVRQGHGQLYLDGELVYDGQWQNGETSQNFNPEQSNQVKVTKSKSRLCASDKKPKNNKYLIRTNYTGSAKLKKQQSTFVGSFKEQQTTSKHKFGHKNCIPLLQFGTFPKEKPHKVTWASQVTPPKIGKKL